MDSIPGGSVSLRSTDRGTAVTFTVTPDKGYEVGAVTVTGRNGGKIAVTDKGGGRYLFTMPAGQVTISAGFVKAGSGDGSRKDCPRDGTFGPHNPVTREQLAVMLWRYAGRPETAGRELHFTDTDEIGGYAQEALRWAVENGIMGGL